ncbi:MAG: glycosyltransferase [Shimia sp.]|uniref:glycosyltransferase n=1 Tax=Shimia sp. TaxID=1954381 RepID=UPI003B8BAA0D
MTASQKFVGRYTTYPDQTGNRQAEGGKRLLGEVRSSSAEKPLISVITVCWNSAETIEQTIRSIQSQTYDNVEYIVVDGNSSDATLDIIRKYEDLIDYYVSEPDTGIYDAMNKGLELAQGEAILLLNSDDWYQDDAVEKLVNAWQYSGCDFVGALALYIGEDGNNHVLPSMSYDHSVLLRMPLRHETMLIPAALYDRIGPYDLRYPIIADFDLTIRLFQGGASYFELREPLLNFRTTGVSNTAMEQLHSEHHDLLVRTFPFLTLDESHSLADHSKARPESFIAAANAHLDQQEFVLAVRAMVKDFGRLWGGFWAEAPIEQIAAEASMKYPKISVIMPVYNASEIVQDTLDSLLLQEDLPEIEVICVDDCSSDDTLSILQKASTLDGRLRFLKNKTNKGPAASRNAAIRKARGQYVFMLDADDRIPIGALRKLYDAAQEHGSTVVRGAFHVERTIHGHLDQGTKYPAGISDRVVAHTNLNEMPGLLSSTEGHWAGLYDRDFIESVLYPEDFRMGEDSLFLIKAMTFAPVVTLIPEPVYVYQDSADSAMNNYTFSKYMDEIEWRRRAWSLLTDAGQKERANFFLFDWWNPPFFAELREALSAEDSAQFFKTLHEVFCKAGSSDAGLCENLELRQILRDAFVDLGLIPAPERELNIAIVTTFDYGGAGIASQRCMNIMREAKQGAFTICAFKRSGSPDAHLAPVGGPAGDAQRAGDLEMLWKHWTDVGVLEEDATPKPLSRELFSKVGSMVEAAPMGAALAQSDVVHLHWVVGMLDLERMEEIIGDRPVIWTLHDMNPFTGGCHYAEGCEQYKKDCANCPLLEGDKSLAHDAWRAKRDAYSKIENLHIVTPSQWLADCAKESSLFGDRPVHVLPNSIPIEHFTPTNKLVARMQLGLPLDAKIVAFGADSLNNKRKGGDILVESVRLLKERGQAENVHGLFFGSASLDLGLPVHNMGYVSDPARLSLVYAAADVFAFPSREDNAPQTVPEALLSGTPIVAFPVGNVPELVHHLETGFIARYEDTSHFAEGLAWALEDTTSNDALIRSLRARTAALDLHNPDSVRDQHLQLYRTVAGV